MDNEELFLKLVERLEDDIDSLRQEMKDDNEDLRKEIKELNQFKFRVYGIASFVSAIVGYAISYFKD